MLGLANLCACMCAQQLQDVPANKEKLNSDDEQVVMEGVIYFREQLSGVCVCACVHAYRCMYAHPRGRNLLQRAVVR